MVANNKRVLAVRLGLSLCLTALQVGAHVRASLICVLRLAALVRTVLDRYLAALVWQFVLLSVRVVLHELRLQHLSRSPPSLSAASTV